MLRILLCAVFAMSLLTACANSNSSGRSRNRPETGGGLSEKFREAEAKKKQRVAMEKAINRGESDLPEGWADTIASCWLVWTRPEHKIDPALDPRTNPRPDPYKLDRARGIKAVQWSEAKGKWLTLGPGAENILVENLLRWYVASYDAGSGYEVQRSKVELAKHRDTAIPYLMAALGNANGDNVVRGRMAELLAYFGEGSASSLAAAYDDASDKGRVEIARALKKMLQPDTIPLLIDIAGSRGDYRPRIEALQALGKLGAIEASPVFQSCLRDDDFSVRKFAGMNAFALGDRSMPMLAALVDGMEAALSEGDQSSAQACHGSLRRLTKKRVAASPDAWRSALGIR